MIVFDDMLTQSAMKSASGPDITILALSENVLRYKHTNDYYYINVTEPGSFEQFSLFINEHTRPIQNALDTGRKQHHNHR